MRENWPSTDTKRGCGCARCRDARRPWWRDPGRRTAYAQAQNRFLGDVVEAALADLNATGGASPKANETTYGDFEVRWKRKVPLKTFLEILDQRYSDPKRQWNYRIYLKGDTRPLYIGYTGPRQGGIKQRLKEHAVARGGETRKDIASPQDAKTRAAEHRRAKRQGLQGDTKLLADIVKSLGLDSFEVMVGEVLKRQFGPGGTVRLVPPKHGAALLTERFQLLSGTARINRPDRAEDDEEDAAAETAIGALVEAYSPEGIEE